MGNILGNLAGCIGGLIFLGVIVLLANGVILLFNRLAKGAKRLDFLTVVAPDGATAKFASGSLSRSSGTSAQIDLVKTIPSMFSQIHSAISERELRSCAKKGRVNLLTYRPGTLADADAAVGAVAGALVQRGVSRDVLKRDRAYSMKTEVTPDGQMAYLVIFGNLPTPPSFFLVPSFD